MSWYQPPNISDYTFGFNSSLYQSQQWGREPNTSDGDSHHNISQFREYQVSKLLWRYMAPGILVVGTIGSILSLLVLCRKSLRSQTTMFYLSALAVADLMVLYVGLVRLWLEHAENIYIRLTSATACKLHNFLVYLSLDLSVWTLVAVSVDRCLYVSWPASARRWCTLINARIVVFVILCLSALVNIHFFWTYDLEIYHSQQIYANGMKKCYADTDSSLTVSFVENVWPWIDFCIYCLCPFLIMATSNAIIIKQLVHTDRSMASYNKVVRDGARGAIPEHGHDQRARSLLSMTFTSHCCCPRSRTGSRKTTRVYREQFEDVTGLSHNNLSELHVTAKGDSKDDDQQTTSMAVTHIDDGLALDDQDVRVGWRSWSSFLDVQHDMAHEVINATPVDLDTFGGSPKGLSLTFEGGLMNRCGTTLMSIHSQGHQSLHDEVTSVDVESNEQPFAQVVDKTAVERSPSPEKREFSVDLDLKNAKRPHSVVQEFASLPILLDERTCNMDPSKWTTGSRLDHCQINVETSETVLSKGDHRIHKLAEGDGSLSNKTFLVCKHFKETPDYISSIEYPDIPSTFKSSKACTSFSPKQTGNRYILVREIKTDSNRKRQIVYSAANYKRQINVMCDNSVNCLDNSSFERSKSSAACFKVGDVVASVARPTCCRDDNASNNTDTIESRSDQVDIESAVRSLSLEDSKLRSVSVITERQTSTTSRRNTRAVSKTLIAVTVMFWVFNAPIVIFIIGHTYFVTSADGRGQALIILGWTIVNILQYMNNALHFFLYCLTGPKFRQELRDMFKEWMLMTKRWMCHR